MASGSVQESWPADLANGVVLTVMKNISPSNPQIEVSHLIATHAIRLVKMTISPVGQAVFTSGNKRYAAKCFGVRVELGGIEGIVAPLVGKQPASIRVWVEEGAAPSFIRMEGRSSRASCMDGRSPVLS